MRIFLAGAAGVIGRRLCPLLIADKHIVFGTTRSTERADWLRAQGVTPIHLDIFDAQSVIDAVSATACDVVIHQLTDVPTTIDPARLPDILARNARIRDEGTHNLLAGARKAGVRRVVAQSIAFAYAPGPKPFRESDPLNSADAGPAGVSARGVESLERQVLEGPWTGIVLRYGRLYGPGASPSAPAPALHLDAAAEVARRALTTGETGIYNVTEAEGFADCAKAQTAFGADAMAAPLAT